MTKTTSQIEFARPATDFEVMQQEHIEQLKVELAEARADVKDRDNALAAIMAVLPDSAKPCDAPDLIKHFKSQMLAYGSEYIRIEKQLTEARAEIERKDKLIEQMRDALKMAQFELESEQNNEWGEPVWHQEEIEQIKAALAAERGE